MEMASCRPVHESREIENGGGGCKMMHACLPPIRFHCVVLQACSSDGIASVFAAGRAMASVFARAPFPPRSARRVVWGSDQMEYPYSPLISSALLLHRRQRVHLRAAGSWQLIDSS
uniref:Uncharacterized protein n=1 Tax=Setaria italica TaxID=4555 RepID=K3YFQ9_SETIT